MIIKAPEDSQTGLYRIDSDKDSLEFNHIQNITPVLERAKDVRKESDNGWTEGRGFRHIASIPTCEFVTHPELVYDKKALIKWLKTEYGSMFKTVNGGIG